MKVFHCDHCQQLVFFENTRASAAATCWRFSRISCSSDRSIRPAASADRMPNRATASGHRRCPPHGRAYRLCANYTDTAGLQLGGAGRRSGSPLCLVPADAGDSRSVGARPSGGVVPARGRQAAARSTRCSRSGCRSTAAGGAESAAVSSSWRTPDPSEPPVLTGHAERHHHHQRRGSRRCRARAAADGARRAVSDAARAHAARDRALLLERCSSAATPERLERFRELFGDEREDYAAALAAALRSGRAGGLAGSVRQRVRERARRGRTGPRPGRTTCT